MDLVGRMKKYMEHLELPISQFADIALIPRPTLSQILTGRNRKISNELLEKLHNAFPRLNISWLLFGDGEMENNTLPKISAQNQPLKSDEPTSAPGAFAQSILDFEPIDNPVLEPLAGSSSDGTAPNAQHDDKADSDSSPSFVSVNPDANKKIQSIMVFYSDNSFEIFKPSQR